jgi:hypothetical protein
MTSGTILITTTNIPMVKHVGICILLDGKIYVLHNSPVEKNKVGGNVVCDDLNDFLIDREVINKINTYFTSEYLLNKAVNVSKNKWDAKLFNCEDFVNYLTDINIHPTQSAQALAVVSVAVLCTYIFI